MPKKHDRMSVRQEAFAIHVANGQPLVDAYHNAGFTAQGNAAYVGASKLMRQAKVEAKVRAIQGKFEDAMVRSRAASHAVTAHTVTRMLEEVYEAAKRDKQHGAAATAAMGLAKLHGLLVDKTEDVTRRAARSPNAPVEIEVEHWLSEQGVAIEHQVSPTPTPTNPEKDAQAVYVDPLRGADAAAADDDAAERGAVN
jgi:hypothetical protein